MVEFSTVFSLVHLVLIEIHMDSRFERGHKRSMSEKQVYLKFGIMRMNIIFSDIRGNFDTHLGSFFFSFVFQENKEFVTTKLFVLERFKKKSGSRSSGFTSQLRFLLEENPKTVSSVMREFWCTAIAQTLE